MRRRMVESPVLVPGSDDGLERLAEALARALASYWRRRPSEEQEAAAGKTAAKEVRDAGARPSRTV